jgi:hypothetical protein
MIHLCYHKRTLRKMYYEIFIMLPQATNYTDGVSLKLCQNQCYIANLCNKNIKPLDKIECFDLVIRCIYK